MAFSCGQEAGSEIASHSSAIFTGTLIKSGTIVEHEREPPGWFPGWLPSWIPRPLVDTGRTTSVDRATFSVVVRYKGSIRKEVTVRLLAQQLSGSDIGQRFTVFASIYQGELAAGPCGELVTGEIVPAKYGLTAQPPITVESPLPVAAVVGVLAAALLVGVMITRRVRHRTG
jgi:hypothetical protein